MPVDVTASFRPLVQRLLSEARVEAAYGDLVLSFLDHTAAEGDGQRAVTLLPALACEAHGGDPNRAAPACAAWLALRLAAKLLDDVEDRDLGADQPLHVNASTGLLEMAHLCVGALACEGVPGARVNSIGTEMSRTVLRAAGGQHRDLAAGRDIHGLDPDGWLSIAAAKSGALFGWAPWAGAAVAGAEDERLEGYRRYGECVGVLLQIADDYNDVWRAGASAAGREAPPVEAPNLPMAYARLVADGAARRRLDAAVQAAGRGEVGAGATLRAALTDLGAQAFVLAAGRAQYRLAAEALRAAVPRPPAEGRLMALLDGIMPALRVVSQR